VAPLRLDLGGLHEEYVVGRAPRVLTTRTRALLVVAAVAWAVAAAVLVLGVLDAHPLQLLPLLTPAVLAVAAATRGPGDRRPRTRLEPTGLLLRTGPSRTERVPWRAVYRVTADAGRGRPPGEVWLSDGRRLPLVRMPRRDVLLLADALDEARPGNGPPPRAGSHEVLPGVAASQPLLLELTGLRRRYEAGQERPFRGSRRTARLLFAGLLAVAVAIVVLGLTQVIPMPFAGSVIGAAIGNYLIYWSRWRVRTVLTPEHLDIRDRPLRQRTIAWAEVDVVEPPVPRRRRLGVARVGRRVPYQLVGMPADDVVRLAEALGRARAAAAEGR
jgi:hypothetical protein